MLFTCCWVMDEFTRENVSPPPPRHPLSRRAQTCGPCAQGCTSVLPGSMLEMRDPTAQEVQVAEQGGAAIAMECPAGSVAMWDGRVCEYPSLMLRLR